MKKATHLLMLLLALLVSPLMAQEKENLGTKVNSEYDELSPYISPDGKTLFFVRGGDPNNTQIDLHDDAQDIWYCELQPDGKWGEAKHMGEPFNIRKYNSVNCMSPDGNILYITGAYEDGEYVGRGISASYHKGDSWGTLNRIDVTDLGVMSRGLYSGSYISNDNKVLILQFSEEDGDDYSDLYVSFNSEGVWSRPRKLPEPISTPEGSEISPFLASDGKTLYFAANQRDEGYGSYDIYMTKRLDDTWMNWSEPKNLGPQVNTKGFEGYFALDAKGEYAYIVSSLDSYGLGDIYRLKLPDNLRPSPVVIVYGTVYNSKTNQPIEASVEVNNLGDGTQVGLARSNPSNGSYKIVMPMGKKYGFSASGTDYYPTSDNIDLTKETGYREIKRDLYLTPIEVGSTVRLNNIFFDPGKAILSPESSSELDRVIDMMNSNPNMTIQITGHTDDLGADDVNFKLSQDRAAAVKTYLISKGINTTRLTSKGYGEAKPIAANDTEDNRQRNRRVEITILKK